MFRPRSARIALASFLLTLATPLAAQMPAAQGYVTDLAGVLNGTAKSEIESLLRSVEVRTSAEIAVATVPSLDGMTVEEYANRLFKEWGVGQEDKDNGVLLLVAPPERKVRIEVGYGLEPVLPDGLAGEIIRNEIVPAFKNGDFPLGILAGIRRIATIVEANHTLTPEERSRLDQSEEGDQPPMLLMIPFFGLFIGMGALAMGVGLRARAFFPLIWGSMFGGIPFLMSLVPFFNAPIVVLGPLALAMFAFGYVKGGSEGWMKLTRGTSSRKGHSTDSTGWIMGGSSSSSSGGGSSSSGSSFGGGSSGGGGASGRW